MFGLNKKAELLISMFVTMVDTCLTWLNPTMAWFFLLLSGKKLLTPIVFTNKN